MRENPSGSVMTAEGVDAPNPRRPRRGTEANAWRLEPPRASQLVPASALVLGCVLTAASYKSSWVHLAYHLPRMHAIIDTTIGLVSVLLAYLVHSRARAMGAGRDYVLVFALGFGGLVNLIAAFTQGISSMPLGRAEVWTAMIGRLDVALVVRRGGAGARYPAATHRLCAEIRSGVGRSRSGC